MIVSMRLSVMVGRTDTAVLAGSTSAAFTLQAKNVDLSHILEFCQKLPPINTTKNQNLKKKTP